MDPQQYKYLIMIQHFCMMRMNMTTALVLVLAWITSAWAQLITDEGTGQPLILRTRLNTHFVVNAIEEDPDNGNVLMGGYTSDSSSGWLGMTRYEQAHDPHKLEWMFTFQGMNGSVVTNVHFTPDSITSVGHKLGVFLFGSPSWNTQYYYWIDPYPSLERTKFSFVANALSYSASSLNLEEGICLPNSLLTQVGQTIFILLGACDGTVRTGNSQSKVFSLQKWNMTNTPCTIDWQYEFKLKNDNLRPGIESMPWFVVAKDKSKFYMAVSTPARGDRTLQTCLLKWSMPPTVSDIRYAQMSQSCVDESVQKNCGDGTTDGCLLWTPGPIAHYDKLVGVISRRVTFTNNRRVTKQDSSELRFYGECAPNTDKYIQLAFDGNSLLGTPKSTMALNSTSNYVAVVSAMTKSETFYSTLLIYHVHFDPDPNGCESRSFLTPPSVSSHALRYFDGGGQHFISPVGRQTIVVGRKHGAFLISGAFTQYPSNSASVFMPAKVFSVLQAVRFPDIDLMQIHEVTAVTSPFQASNLDLFQMAASATLTFLLTLHSQHQLQEASFFQPSAPFFSNCFQQLRLLPQSKFKAGSSHVLEMGSDGIKLDELFQTTGSANCKVVNAGVVSNYFGEGSLSEWSFDGRALVPSRVMDSQVVIWASNGIDQVYSPQFKLKVIEPPPRCDLIKPEVTAATSQTLLTGTKSKVVSMDLLQKSIVSYKTTLSACPLSFSIDGVLTQAGSRLSPSSFASVVSVDEVSGVLSFANYSDLDSGIWNNSKILISAKSAYFEQKGMHVVSVLLQTRTCKDVAVMFDTRQGVQTMGVEYEMTISGFDAQAVPAPRVSTLNFEVSKFLISEDATLCPVVKYTLVKARKPDGSEVSSLNWVEFNQQTGAGTIQNYQGAQVGTWSLFFHAVTDPNQVNNSSAVEIFQIQVKYSKCTLGVFNIDHGYPLKTLNFSERTYVSATGQLFSVPAATGQVFQLKLNRNPIRNELEFDCPTQEFAISKVTLRSGKQLDIKSLGNIFKVEGETLSVAGDSLMKAAGTELDGTQVFIKTRTNFAISPEALFLKIEVQSIMCSHSDTLEVSNPFTLKLERPNANDQLVYDLKHIFQTVRVSECRLESFRFGGAALADQSRVMSEKVVGKMIQYTPEMMLVLHPNQMSPDLFDGAQLQFQAVIAGDTLTPPYQIVKIEIEELIKFESPVPSTIVVPWLNTSIASVPRIWSYTSPRLLHSKSLPILFTKFSTLLPRHTSVSFSSSTFQISVDRSQVTESSDYSIVLMYGDQHLKFTNTIRVNVRIEYKGIRGERTRISVGADLGGYGEDKGVVEVDGEDAMTRYSRLKKQNGRMETRAKVQRLFDIGFGFFEGIGLLFPGISDEEANKTLQSYKALQPSPNTAPPMIRIKPIEVDGSLQLEFSQTMLLPTDMAPGVLSELFLFYHFTAQDMTVTKGKFVSTGESLTKLEDERGAKTRVLVQDRSEVFLISLTSSAPTSMTFQLSFPSSPSLTSDGLELQITDPSVFISRQTMKPLDQNKQGKMKEIPMIITSEERQKVEGVLQVGVLFLTILLLLLYMASYFSHSTESIWLLVRSCQLIVLAQLVSVPLSGQALIFFQELAPLFRGDLFGVFTFRSDGDIPVSDRFLRLGYETSSVFANTYHLFLLGILIILFFCVLKLIEEMAARFPRSELCRRIGVILQARSFVRECVSRTFKVGKEAYLLVAIAVAVHTDSMIEKPQSKFTMDSLLNTCLILMTLGWPAGFMTVLKFKQARCKVSEYLGNQITAETAWYFVRRLVMALAVVWLRFWPYFQCILLMLASLGSILITLAGKQRFEKRNRLATLNEICVLLVYYMMTVSLNKAIPSRLTSILSSTMIGSTLVCICSNLAVTILTTFYRIFKLRKLSQTKIYLKSLFKKWEKVEESANKSKPIAERFNLQRAIQFCKSWEPHRKWLLRKGKSVHDFEEETKYKQMLGEIEKIKQVKVQVALKKIDEIHENKPQAPEKMSKLMIANLHTLKNILIKQRIGRESRLTRNKYLSVNERNLIFRMQNNYIKIEKKSRKPKIQIVKLEEIENQNNLKSCPPRIKGNKNRVRSSNSKQASKTPKNSSPSKQLMKPLFWPSDEKQNSKPKLIDFLQAIEEEQQDSAEDLNFPEIKLDPMVPLPAVIPSLSKFNSANSPQNQLIRSRKLASKDITQMFFNSNNNNLNTANQVKNIPKVPMFLTPRSSKVRNLLPTFNNVEAPSEYSQHEESEVNSSPLLRAATGSFLDQNTSTKVIVNSSENDLQQAVVQSLLSIPSLVRYFVQADYKQGQQFYQPQNEGEQPMCEFMAQLIQDYFKPTDEKPFKLELIHQIETKICKQKGMAVDFLRLLLDGFYSETSNSAVLKSQIQVVIKETKSCSQGHESSQMLNQPPILKLKKNVNSFVLKKWLSQSKGGKCATCSQTSTKISRKINRMPQILIFQLLGGTGELNEILDFSEYADGGGAIYKAVSVVIKVAETYITFVRRNRTTVHGTVQMDWLRFSKETYNVSDWREVKFSGTPELIVYALSQ